MTCKSRAFSKSDPGVLIILLKRLSVIALWHQALLTSVASITTADLFQKQSVTLPRSRAVFPLLSNVLRLLTRTTEMKPNAQKHLFRLPRIPAICKNGKRKKWILRKAIAPPFIMHKMERFVSQLSFLPPPPVVIQHLSSGIIFIGGGNFHLNICR